uniref:protein-serine/threonine phosphatase n=1 Tax=Scleropages formosus TaxID=113540 RepID=A0A8D0CK85_SCLFO
MKTHSLLSSCLVCAVLLSPEAFAVILEIDSCEDGRFVLKHTESKVCAVKMPSLCFNSVGYILNVTREIDNFFPESFTYMNIRVYDVESTDLLSHWNNTYSFINKARCSGQGVLVHCKMGVSRSASTVVAFVMKQQHWTLERALAHVRERRPIIQPNEGFMKQLHTYSGILSAR